MPAASATNPDRRGSEIVFDTRARIEPRRHEERAIQVSVSRNIDHLAQSAGKREIRLAAGHFGSEREAPERALKLITPSEASGRVCPRGAKRLPASAVMHEQIDHDTLPRDRTEHSAAEGDRAFGARSSWSDDELYACTH